jgi:hypothetical protein
MSTRARGCAARELIRPHNVRDRPDRVAGWLTARPHQRPARVILIGEEIFTKVDGYVLGNLLTSVIAGIGGRARRPLSGNPLSRGAGPPAVRIRVER